MCSPKRPRKLYRIGAQCSSQQNESLQAGNVFYGHCDFRLSQTTNSKANPCKDNLDRIVKRFRYVCYGENRKQTKCDVQTGYIAISLMASLISLCARYLNGWRLCPKTRASMSFTRKRWKSGKRCFVASRPRLLNLWGESVLSQTMLGSLIADAETKCLEVQQFAA